VRDIYIYSILEFQVYGTAVLLPRSGPFRPCAPSVLPPAPSVLARALPLLPRAPSLLVRAPPQPLSLLLLSCAPSLLPLKRPCSLSRPWTAIPNPKFGVCIIYIYIIHPELRIGIALFNQKREQHRGSIEGVGGSTEGAEGRSKGTLRE
jgi:hypothetical protein